MQIAFYSRPAFKSYNIRGHVIYFKREIRKGCFFMENNIDKAYKSWQQAINVFNNAVTKEDIDYAIFNMEAKKRQYLRLLNAAKNLSDETAQNSDFS